jgi:glucose-6-phosphate dehydrogenase assembly protein OpcA
MAIELTSTNASEIAGALLSERRKAGSPTMGMVMTLLVVMEEGDQYDALKVARAASREHPARIIGIIRRTAKGGPEIDAELSIGGSGETVLLRLRGEVTQHAQSVVLPLLLPDSPVVTWWPNKAPDDTGADPLGRLADRRITDSAIMARGKTQAILTQARAYVPGNTDLAWTRLTPWRALLAAALDQYPARIQGGEVAAEKQNPSADLLIAWLACRLDVDIARTVSKGPGITSVALQTGGGPIEISRPDGLLARFTIPNAPNRPVALKRREGPELLAEELRRLDPDDIYAYTVEKLCELGDGAHTGVRSRSHQPTRAARAGPTDSSRASTDDAATSARSLSRASVPEGAPTSVTGEGSTKGSGRSAAKKSSTRRSAGKSSIAEQSTGASSTARAATRSSESGTASKSTAKKSAGKKAGTSGKKSTAAKKAPGDGRGSSRSR